jgi:hypothetical protein
MAPTSVSSFAAPIAIVSSRIMRGVHAFSRSGRSSVMSSTPSRRSTWICS